MELCMQDNSPTVIGHTVDSLMCNNILAYSRLPGSSTLNQLVQTRGWSLQPALPGLLQMPLVTLAC